MRCFNCTLILCKYSRPNEKKKRKKKKLHAIHLISALLAIILSCRIVWEHLLRNKWRAGKSATEHTDSSADSSSGRWWQVETNWHICGCLSSQWSWPGTFMLVHCVMMQPCHSVLQSSATALFKKKTKQNKVQRRVDYVKLSLDLINWCSI